MRGRTIGRYRILGELGRGGMGVVYRAEDPELRREVALKALPVELAGDPKRVARLRREARSLAAASHPCIVTIYGIEEHEGRLYLAMELVAGASLAEVIPPRGIELPRLLRLAIPLADAVSAAHEKGLVHRDLKPSNIMVTPEGRVKVLDFGLAAVQQGAGDAALSQLSTEDGTAPGAVLGTPAYMAPEQIRGEAADRRSDIFALGLVLYQMATGRHPFHPNESSPAELSSAILRDQPPRLTEARPELPRQLARVVESCLEKDPEHRLQSAKDLRNQLERLEEELAEERAGSPTPAERRTARWPYGLAAGTLLAVILAAIGLLAGRRDMPEGPVDPPAYVTLVEARFLSGELGPEDYRSGLLAALGDRLEGLEGVWRVPPQGDPLPDLSIEADLRRRGEGLTLAFRIHDPVSGATLASDALEGSARDPIDLLDRAGVSIASFLGRELDRSVVYRARPPPTSDTEAFEDYLRARAAVTAPGEPDPEAGLERVRRALRADSGFARARALEGELLISRFRVGRDEASLRQAAAACRKAVDSAPELAAAHLCLARAFHALGRPLEASASYMRALELDPADWDAHLELHQVYRELGVPEGAERAWRRLIERHPTHWSGHASLGRYLADANRREEAVEQLRAAVALAPRSAWAYRNLGNADYFLGRYQEAISAYERTLALQPDFSAQSNIGAVYFQLRRFPEAVSAFERAEAFPEAGCSTYGNVARAYYWAPGRREEAPAAFARAARLCRERAGARPSEPGDWLWLAYSLAMLGEEEESLAALDQALTLAPTAAHNLEWAARIFDHLGQRQRALDLLERALALGYPRAELLANIEYDDLRRDPRFRSLVGEGVVSGVNDRTKGD